MLIIRQKKDGQANNLSDNTDYILCKILRMPYFYSLFS